MLLPPSMARVCPVMKEAPDPARKATVSATLSSKFRCGHLLQCHIQFFKIFEVLNLLHSAWPSYSMGGLAMLKEPNNLKQFQSS